MGLKVGKLKLGAKKKSAVEEEPKTKKADLKLVKKSRVVEEDPDEDEDEEEEEEAPKSKKTKVTPAKTKTKKKVKAEEVEDPEEEEEEEEEEEDEDEDEEEEEEEEEEEAPKKAKKKVKGAKKTQTQPIADLSENKTARIALKNCIAAETALLQAEKDLKTHLRKLRDAIEPSRTVPRTDLGTNEDGEEIHYTIMTRGDKIFWRPKPEGFRPRVEEDAEEEEEEEDEEEEAPKSKKVKAATPTKVKKKLITKAKPAAAKVGKVLTKKKKVSKSG